MSLEQCGNHDQYGDRAEANGEWEFAGAIAVDIYNPLLFDDNACVFESGHYSMLSLSDFGYRWRLPLTDDAYSGGPDFCAGGFIYATLNGRVRAIHTETGKITAIFEDPDCVEICWHSDRLILVGHGESTLLAFDLKSGRRLWRADGEVWINSVYTLASYVVVERCEDGIGFIEVLAEASGERVAQIDPMHPLIQGDSRFQLKDWSLSRSNRCMPLSTIGDSLMITYTDGNLARLRLPSLEIVWVCALPARADNVIYHDDKLYATISGDADVVTNPLTCIDWATGQILWALEQPFTPAGMAHAIMIGKFVIAGRGEHAAAYDVENRRFVWHYNDGVRRFGLGLSASGSWLVSHGHPASHEIHVFKRRD